MNGAGSQKIESEFASESEFIFYFKFIKTSEFREPEFFKNYYNKNQRIQMNFLKIFSTIKIVI